MGTARCYCPPNTIYFLGTGQVGKVARWVSEHMPLGTVVVEGLPHWQSDPSGADLLTFTNGYTQAAYQFVLKTFDQSAMHLMAGSQSTPGAIWYANRYPDTVRNIVFMLPMGLTTSFFGTTDRTRLRELKRRAFRSSLQFRQSPLYDYQDTYISLHLSKLLLRGVRDGSAATKYMLGISHDVRLEFRNLVKG